MNSTLLSVLPLALGAAISPTLLTLVVLILSGKYERKKRAWAFTAGCAITLILYMLIVATVARGLQLTSANQSNVERAIKLLAAVLLLWLGIRALRKHAGGDSPMKEKFADAKLVVFLTAGVVAMASNFSSLVLVLPATHITMNADLPPVETNTVLAVVFLITMTPVLVPVLIATVAGARGDVVLERLNGFTSAHARQINAGIAFFFAALLTYSALK